MRREVCPSRRTQARSQEGSCLLPAVLVDLVARVIRPPAGANGRRPGHNGSEVEEETTADPGRGDAIRLPGPLLAAVSKPYPRDRSWETPSSSLSIRMTRRILSSRLITT